MRLPLLSLLVLLLGTCSLVSGGSLLGGHGSIRGGEPGGSAPWVTEGGSNLRAGATPLPIPDASLDPAPLRVAWRLPLLLNRAGDCVPSPVASQDGWVFLLCEEVVESRMDDEAVGAVTMLQPTVYAFNATADGSMGQQIWRTALDALPASPMPDAPGALLPPAQGSLALSSDQLWLLVATRGAVYALSSVLGTRAWTYPFFMGQVQPAFPLGSGLALSTLSSAEPTPRVYLSLNLGVACIKAGSLAWQYRATERADNGEPVVVSTPTLYEEGGVVLYTQLHVANASLTLLALDAVWGAPKWQVSFAIARRYLTASSLPPLRAPYPVVVGKRAYVSVRGRGLVVLDAVSGDVLADGLNPAQAGRLVQMGVPPTWAPAKMGDSADSDSDDRILSVCINPMYDADAEAEPYALRPWKPMFQLCASDLSGNALDQTGRFLIGCDVHSIDAASGEAGMSPAHHFQPSPAVGQVLYGSNGVTLVSLLAFSPNSSSGSSPEPVHMESCVAALPDLRSQPRWQMPLPPKQLLLAPVLLLSSSRAVALTRDDTTLSLYGLQTAAAPGPAPSNATQAEEVDDEDELEEESGEAAQAQQLERALEQMQSGFARLRDRVQRGVASLSQNINRELIERIRERIKQRRREEESEGELEQVQPREPELVTPKAPLIAQE